MATKFEDLVNNMVNIGFGAAAHARRPSGTAAAVRRRCVAASRPSGESRLSPQGDEPPHEKRGARDRLPRAPCD